MGSVPRINCLLVIVPLEMKDPYWIFHVKYIYQYEKLNKGVSIWVTEESNETSAHLPYALKMLFIISNN
jgi:hypothetical protein